MAETPNIDDIDWGVEHRVRSRPTFRNELVGFFWYFRGLPQDDLMLKILGRVAIGLFMTLVVGCLAMLVLCLAGVF